MSFVKIDCNILTSSLWVDSPAKDLFITALLMARPIEIKEDTETLKTRSLDRDDFIIPPGWYGKVEAASTGIIRQQGTLDREPGLDALERALGPRRRMTHQSEDAKATPWYRPRKTNGHEPRLLLMSIDPMREH